jgi:large subunit ribosomal protein L29
MVRAAELVTMDPDELVSRLDESRKELFNLRFQLATGQLDNPARMGQVRRDVARIMTVLREREIEEAEGLWVEAEEVPAAAAPARPARARRAARAGQAADAAPAEAGPAGAEAGAENEAGAEAAAPAGTEAATEAPDGGEPGDREEEA